MAKDFLLEIGVEEMPARFLMPALNELKELTEKKFNELRLGYRQINIYGTPRRLTLQVQDLDEMQAPLEKEVKGPAKKAAFDADGNPTKAILGFVKGQGVNLADLVVRYIGKVEYLYAIKQEAGSSTREILAELCPELITGLHFPKPMRWGANELRFARPIRWLVALFGPDVIDFTLAGTAAGRVTYGHRFLSRGPLALAEPGAYFQTMADNYVMVDPMARRALIWQQIQELAQGVGGRVEPDNDLLDEITNIVEWPTALCGSFDEEFLQLPAAVLVTPMREHQRYFPVLDNTGRLLNKFIAVRNGTADNIGVVRAGNEKVLRARLADAHFFFEEDLKEPLYKNVVKINKIVFLEGLGTVADKVDRVGALAEHIAEQMPGGDREQEKIQRAALLAKADLVTNMVYEFPELQGVMGREYARRNGEDPVVAEAVYEHYLPRFAGDDLPVTLPGQALSLADKLDSIVGCFSIGIQPTGSQDPYALRRQALGICHIILERELELSLPDLLAWAYQGYQGAVELKLTQDQVVTEVMEFIKQRLKGIFGDLGLAYDTIEATLAAGFDDISDTYTRARAVAEFRQQPAFDALLTAFNRAYNLAKKAKSTAVHPEYFEHQAEKNLYHAWQNLLAEIKPLQKHKNYPGVFKAIARIQGPVDDFFAGVMVMAEDERVRDNRLALLNNIASLIKSFADFSKLVV